MCRVRLRCKCPCSQLTRGWLEAGEFWGRGVEDFECLVPVDAAECALDIQADECCPWSAGRGGTDFGDFVFGARWASSSELVLAGCDFDLRFGRGGDDSEGEFDEGVGRRVGLRFSNTALRVHSTKWPWPMGACHLVPRR